MPAPVKPDFGEGCIANAFRAELREQAFRHRIAAAIAANILAHQEDSLIAPKRIPDRLANGLAIGNFDHG